jgi:hypothetical protein
VRHTLLRLHKAILDVERNSYERVKGRVGSPHEMLQLVMRDPWFGWFRPLSEMVVQIDELLDSTDIVTEGQAEALFRELRSLLNPVEEGEEFGVKYHNILQEDPGIILAHADISKLLNTD